MDNSAISLLSQLGIAAPFVVAMWSAYLREVKRADSLQTENTRLHTVNEEKTIPTLAAAGAALKEVADMQGDAKLQIEIERRVASALRTQGEKA